MKNKDKIARPFIKWAGGKGQLLSDIQSKYPEELGKSINKYCEPFVGGGAVLFDILSNHMIDEVLINDINIELINVYKQIKNNVDTLILKLQEMQDTYLPLEMEERKQVYYETRDKFNDLKINGDNKVNIEKAVMFIFLNRTCFNGLYRENKKGLFNVPIGSYKNPFICNSINLKLINKLLKNTKIQCGDYNECIDFIDKKTFVYIDPPYRPITKTASFTAYSKNSFDDIEQIRLRDFVNDIHAKKTKTLISNSDPKNTDDNDHFFDELYGAYNIERVEAKRMINCNGKSRGFVSELLISN